MIPKASGGVRGIGLLETIWKVISIIINMRITKSIRFHKSLHGFRANHGTGTAILEARLNLDVSIQKGIPMHQIFLDLTKAYDTLDRKRTLDILERYGLGPNLIRLLRTFWDNLQVVPRQGGFHGSPIRSERGVTQGDPLSPTIFNVVVDAVVRDLLSHPGFNDLKVIFYADDGLIATSNARMAQEAINHITSLFSRMGLQMNATKTKTVLGQPAELHHSISAASYERRMTGIGLTYVERKRQIVECPKCQKQMQQVALQNHLMSVHQEYNRSQRRRDLFEKYQVGPMTYTVSMPTKTGIRCPVPDCIGHADSRTNLRKHFAHRHPIDIIIIEEEGPLPRCNSCQMFVSTANQPRHLATDICTTGTTRHQKRILELTYLEHENVTFSILDEELESLDWFKYLGRPISATGSDWIAVMYNIKKARQRWSQISRILTKQGSNPKVMGYFYKAVCQAVLLYGCETWVITSKIRNALESFHHRVARQISHHVIRFDSTRGEWLYPPIDAALREASLLPLEDYIIRRRCYLLRWSQDNPLLHESQRLQNGVGGTRQRFWWYYANQE